MAIQDQSTTFIPVTIYEYMPPSAPTSFTQPNTLKTAATTMTSTSTSSKATRASKVLSTHDIPETTGVITHSTSSFPIPTWVPSSTQQDSSSSSSSNLSGAERAGLAVGLVVGLILVGLLLAFIVLRRKYGPGVWNVLSGHGSRRKRAPRQRADQGSDLDDQGMQDMHRVWYRQEHLNNAKMVDDRDSRTVLANLWGSLKRPFTLDEEKYDMNPGHHQNAMPLENQHQQDLGTDNRALESLQENPGDSNAIPLEHQCHQKRRPDQSRVAENVPHNNLREILCSAPASSFNDKNQQQVRTTSQSWNTDYSSHNNPQEALHGSPAMIHQTPEPSRASVPAYWAQYYNQSVAHSQAPSLSQVTTVTSTQNSGKSRSKRKSSWAHFQKQRHQQRPRSRLAPVGNQHTLNAGPSGNRRSTRQDKQKNRPSSTSSTATLPVFRQHPGQLVDMGPASPKKRIRSSVLSRLMLG